MRNLLKKSLIDNEEINKQEKGGREDKLLPNEMHLNKKTSHHLTLNQTKKSLKKKRLRIMTKDGLLYLMSLSPLTFKIGKMMICSMTTTSSVVQQVSISKPWWSPLS